MRAATGRALGAVAAWFACVSVFAPEPPVASALPVSGQPHAVHASATIEERSCDGVVAPIGVDVLHVGRDGYATIGEALSHARSGQTVWIAAGTYREQLAIPEGVTLAGACAEGTRIIATSASEDEGVVTAAGDAIIRDLRISGERPGIVVGPLPATLTIERVTIEGAAHQGIVAVGLGVVRGHDVVVRGTHGDRFARGLSALEGGVIELSRVMLEDSAEAGAVASGAESRVALVDAMVRRAGTIDGLYGYGVVAEGGAVTELTRVVVESTYDAGLRVEGAGTRARAVDLIVRDTHASPSGEGGHGVHVSGHARLEIERARIEGSERAGLLARSRATRVQIRDAVIERGIVSEDGATVDQRRVVFSAPRELVASRK